MYQDPQFPGSAEFDDIRPPSHDRSRFSNMDYDDDEFDLPDEHDARGEPEAEQVGPPPVDMDDPIAFLEPPAQQVHDKEEEEKAMDEHGEGNQQYDDPNLYTIVGEDVLDQSDSWLGRGPNH